MRNHGQAATNNPLEKMFAHAGVVSPNGAAQITQQILQRDLPHASRRPALFQMKSTRNMIAK